MSDIKIKYSRNYVVGQNIFWLLIKFWQFLWSLAMLTYRFSTLALGPDILTTYYWRLDFVRLFQSISIRSKVKLRFCWIIASDAFSSLTKLEWSGIVGLTPLKPDCIDSYVMNHKIDMTLTWPKTITLNYFSICSKFLTRVS